MTKCNTPARRLFDQQATGQSATLPVGIKRPGLVLGVVKSGTLLDRLAHKAVERIRMRGRGNILGFFSLRSWLLVAVMMGGGIVLRNIVVHPGVVGAGILGTIYIGVGTALLIADRIFWVAALRYLRHSR